MIGRLNHVAIAVPNLAAAVAQYRDTLGAMVGAGSMGINSSSLCKITQAFRAVQNQHHAPPCEPRPAQRLVV